MKAAIRKGAAGKSAVKKKAPVKKSPAKRASAVKSKNDVIGIEFEGHPFEGRPERLVALESVIRQILEDKSEDMMAALKSEPLQPLATSGFKVLSVNTVKPGQSSAGHTLGSGGN